MQEQSFYHLKPLTLNFLLESLENTTTFSFFWERFLIPRKDYRYIIAISGGPDSVFLAWLYAKLYKMKYISEPILFHFNHKIRKESEQEEEFVIRFASQWNLPLYIESRDIKKLSEKLKKNLEETARIFRYRALFRLVHHLNEKSFVLTGHHADDYIETVFLRLLRGASLRNIDFPAMRRLPVNIAKKMQFLIIFSPLLLFRKSEIIDFLESRRISYIQDSSNWNLEYKRNFIRHQIIKKFSELGFRSSYVWQRTHLSLDFFQPPEISNRFSSIYEFCIIEKYWLENLSNREIKIIFDQITRKLGIFPFQRGVIAELIKQSRYNKIYIETSECIIESVKDKIWLIRKKSELLKSPRIWESNQQEGYKVIIVEWNSQKRKYVLQPNCYINFLDKEVKKRRKEKVNKILQQKAFPNTIRKYIPYIYKENHTFQIQKILVSFLKDFWDISF